MARNRGKNRKSRTQYTIDGSLTTIKAGGIKGVAKPSKPKVIGTTLHRSQFGRSGGTQMHNMFKPGYSRDKAGRLRYGGKMVKQSVPKVAVGTAQVKLEVS